MPGRRLMLGVAFAVATVLAAATDGDEAGATFAGRTGVIAYATGGGETNYTVRAVRADGTADRRLIGRRKVFKRGPSDPQWSADGEKLLFGGHDHYDRAAAGLWIASASGTRLRRIPLGLGAVRLSGWGWAPDGRRIVFAAERRRRPPRLGPGSTPTIYTIRIDGRERRRLRHGSDPSWSPDGRSIVFSREYWPESDPRFLGNRVHEIFVMRPSGRGLRRLTSGDGDASPSFAPDARKVVYVRTIAPATPGAGDWRDEWRTVGVDGSGDALLASHPIGDSVYCPPHWAPDGKLLGAVRTDRLPGTDTEIARFVTVSAAGTDERVAFTFPNPYVARFTMCDFSWQPR